MNYIEVLRTGISASDFYTRISSTQNNNIQEVLIEGVPYRLTPMMAAVFCGRKDVVGYLLDNHLFDKEDPYKLYYTAITNEDIEMAMLLNKKEVDIKVIDCYSHCNLLHVAADKNKI